MRKVVMRFYCIFSFFLIATVSQLFAEEKKSKVFDLGEMSVVGELSKPGIQWIDSQRLIKEQLPQILKAEFERIENKLLQPDSVTPTQPLKEQGNSHVRD